MTTTYNGYQINQTLGKTPTFYITNAKGQDLFYCIPTMDKAKSLVDGWNVAKKVLSR